MLFISEKSITTPSSQVDLPAMLWAPPLMARGRPLSRAKFTAATTSPAPRHLAMTAGRLSIIAFQTRRYSSYRESVGVINAPRFTCCSRSMELNAIDM
jgi:hypothetical protein